MPFTGSTFSRLYNWVSDRDAAINILASKMDAEMDGYASAINQIMQGAIPFAGAVKGSSGTVSAPAWSFSADTDTGLYRIGANNLGVATGGVKRVDISNTRVSVSVSAKVEVTGNVTAGNSDHGAFIKGPTPTLTFVDTEVGHGSGQWQFSNNGIKFIIDTDNDELVGATSNTSDTELLNLTNAVFQYKGNTLWHAANDGAGSGLDADLLDGQHGSYYQNASNLNAGTINDARLPSTITKNTTGTHSGNVTGTINGTAVANFWHSGNDGAGSGLDADLLDGINASSFLRSNANDVMTGLLDFSRPSTEQFRLGYNTGASREAYFGIYDGLTTRRGYLQGRTSYVRLGSDFGGLFDLYGSGDARINGNTIMHGGNDGAGSGFDADLLDGQHGSYYQNASNLNAGTINDARLPATITSSITGNAATATNATQLDGQTSSYYRNASNLNAGTIPDARLQTTGTWTPSITNVGTGTIPITTYARREYIKTGDLCIVNCLLKVGATPSDDECRMSLPFNANNLQLLGECWMLGDAVTFPNQSDIDDYITTDGVAHSNLNHGSGLVRDGYFYFKTGVYGSIGSAGIDNGWLHITFRYRTT